MNSHFYAVLFAAASCTAASPQLTTYTGPGGPINDLATVSFTIFVPDHGPADVYSIAASMHHTWVGDLRINVRKATLQDYSVRLLNHPTRDPFGDFDDLVGEYTFRDGFAPIAAEGYGTGTVPPGTYGPTPGQIVTRTIHDVYGEWVFTVRDNAAGDVGNVDWWSITFDTIPAPGAPALFGLCGAAMLRRKRP